MSDLDRARELVADVFRALSIMDPVPPTEVEYMAVVEIARAGLALRVDLDNADIRIGSDLIAAVDAFDACLGAALPPEAGATDGGE